MKSPKILSSAALLLTLVTGLEARAVPILSGDIALVAAPVSVDIGAFEDDDYIRLFLERNDTTLGSNVAVDILMSSVSGSKTFDDDGDLFKRNE